MPDHRRYALHHWLTARRHRCDRTACLCVIGVLLTTIAWWSSHRMISAISIPLFPHRSFAVTQWGGRIDLTYWNRRNAHLDSFFEQVPVSAFPIVSDRPSFEARTFSYPIPSRPWSGYEVCFPNWLPVVLLAIAPVIRHHNELQHWAWIMFGLPEKLLMQARSIEPSSFRLDHKGKSFRIQSHPTTIEEAAQFVPDYQPGIEADAVEP